MKTIDSSLLDKRQTQVKIKEENKETLKNLFGMEIALEDNISTKGIKTEVGSKMLEGYIPPFNAEVVERLLNNDATIKGKVETSEFGVGERIDSQMGQVVKTGQVEVSIGIDAQGEIRRTAAASKLYGLKPTYGSISRYGLIGSAPSLESVGIIAESIDKMEAVFKTIEGKDKKDSTSLVKEEREIKDLKSIKVGVLKEHFHSQDKEVKDEIEKSIATFRAMGMTVERVSIPSVKHSSSIYNILQSAEFSSDMGKFDGVVYGYRTPKYKDNEDFFKRNRTEGFSDLVKKKIMFGNFVLSEGSYKDYYEKSQKIRTLIAKEVSEIFKNCDIVLNPILGEEMEYTVLANLVGLPALSIPSCKSGLGIQIMGPKFSEETLFEIARSYEKEGK